MKKTTKEFKEKIKTKKKKIIEDFNKRNLKKKNRVSIDKQLFDDYYVLENHVEKKELELINLENFIVRKNNDLTQKASFNFELDELKVINYSIAKIIANQNLTENDELEFSMNNLMLVLGKSTGGENYKRIKKTLDNISDEKRWVTIPKENGEDELQFRFFMKVKIDKSNSKNNIVKIRFMQEFLDAIKINNKSGKFTEETLIFSLLLNSKYAIRLYELAKSWQENFLYYVNENGKEVPIFGFSLYFDKIKKSWCLPETYKSGKIKTIIDSAIEDINKNTDIELRYGDKPIKKGKEIIGYEIKIRPNDMTKICKKIADRRNILLEK